MRHFSAQNDVEIALCDAVLAQNDGRIVVMAKKPAGAGVYLCTPAHGSGACRALPRARASSRRGRTAPLADGGAVDDLPRSRSYGCARTEITWDFRPPPSGEPDPEHADRRGKYTTAYKRSAVNVEYRQLFIHRRISMRRPLAPAWGSPPLQNMAGPGAFRHPRPCQAKVRRP